MQILMLASNDPAGMGIAFTKAINKYSKHTCRLITTETCYNFDFEKDIHIPDLSKDELNQIPELIIKADILHFHTINDENLKLGPFRISDFSKGKSILHHHHGHHHFRANPELYRDKYNRLKRKAIVSTPDLLHLLPDATWIPNIVPLEEPLYLPAPTTDRDTICIGQSPTRTDLKNTKEFLKITKQLKKEFAEPQLEVKLIQNCKHSECLKQKNDCQIIFDHMQGYFGVSSLEALSMGKPVIAGLDSWNIKNIKKFTGSDKLPWLIAKDSSGLQTVLTKMLTHQDVRIETGQWSRQFMENFWTESHVLQVLNKVYQEL